jgi:hypothetical protein
MVWLDYYSGIDDASSYLQERPESQRHRNGKQFRSPWEFATVNNADMPVRLVVLKKRHINY